jgi:hypothetical protein
MMVKSTCYSFNFSFGFFRKRIPEILIDNLSAVTQKGMNQEEDPVRKHVQDTEWDDPEKENERSEKKIGQDFHAAKLIKSLNLSPKLHLHVNYSQAQYGSIFQPGYGGICPERDQG